jgi:lipooligosaccharide transport system ATP-binding protein
MSSDGRPLLAVRDLEKHYRKHRGDTVAAVGGISFEVKAGECFGLLGPNGAGKSTTINCITGFYPPTRGSVLIDGHDAHGAPKQARQLLGVCPQEDTLDTDFRVLDQLVRHAAFFRIPTDEAKRRAQDLIGRFKLEGQESEEVESLSGGMRRKLQVARALISDPKVLVLDEPTTGLDPDARRTLWEIIGECRERGMAVLLSTHYMDEAERLCDRIGMLHKGKLLDLASPQELIARYVATPTIEEEIRPGVKWKRAANLEDVFLGLTGDTLGGAP